MISCNCNCAPQISVVKNLKPDAIKLKRQMVLNKLKNSSESASNWFVKLSLQKLLGKNVPSSNTTIFNYETSDLLLLTGSPVQASTPHFSNKRKSHKQNIIKEHSESQSLQSNSFKQPENEVFSTSTANNRNSLGISLDDSTYSWTSSLATPPCYNKIDSEGVCKDEENMSEITQSKFFARALFSPNGETSELEDSATLSTTIQTELNDNDKSLTTTDLSKYSPETSSPVLFETINNDDSKGYPTLFFHTTETINMSSPPVDSIKKEDSSLLHSILIKNKQQTSLHKSVHFSDILSPVLSDKLKSELVSEDTTMIFHPTDIHCITKVSGDLTPDYNSLKNNVNHSPVTVNLDFDKNEFKMNEENVNCCKSSNLNNSFESATLEQNPSKPLNNPVDTCEISRNVVDLDIDKNLEHAKKIQSKQHSSTSENNLKTVEGCLNDICSQEKHGEKFDSVKTLLEVKLVDGVCERTSERQKVDSYSECENTENKQLNSLLISCEPNVTLEHKITTTPFLSKKNRLKRKTKRFSYPTASQIHQSSPAVKFSFKMQTFSTNNSTENNCSDSNNPIFPNITSDLVKPIVHNNNNNNMPAKDNVIPTNNPVESNVVQNNKTVEGCFRSPSNTVDNIVVQIKNIEENGAVQTNNTAEGCAAVQTNNTAEGCAAVQINNTVESCTAVQTNNTAESCAAVQTNSTIESCAAVQTNNTAEGCIAVQTNNTLEDCAAVQINNTVESCTAVQTNNTAEGCTADQTNNTVEGCAAVQTNNTVETCAAIQTNNTVIDCAVVQTDDPVENCSVQTNNNEEGCTAVQTNDTVEGVLQQKSKNTNAPLITEEHSLFPDIYRDKNISLHSEENLSTSVDQITDKQQMPFLTYHKEKLMHEAAIGKIHKTPHIFPHKYSLRSSKNKSSLPQNNVTQASVSSGIVTKRPNEDNKCKNILIYNKTDFPYCKQFKDISKHNSSVEDHFTASQIVYWQSSEDFSESFNDELDTKLSDDIKQDDSNKQQGQKKIIIEKVENGDQNIKVQNIQINEESLQKTEHLRINSEETIEKFQGFSTAKGKKIPIKEQSLQKAQSLVDDFNETVPDFQGFSTTNGGKIPIKEQSLQKAQNLLNDFNETVPDFHGFSTAKGGKIPIKEQSLQKAHTLEDDCNKTEKFQGFSTAKGGKIPIKEQSLQKAQSLVDDCNKTVETFQGFSTAKGGKIPIKEQSLQKAQSLVDDCNKTVETFQGFSTAKGGKIPIKEQSLQKAQSLVDDCNKTVETFQGFSTAKGGKIPIKEQSLQKAQSLVDDCNKTVETFQGFSTAKGGKIPIKEQSLQKAQSLVDDCNKTVEKFQGFSTSKGGKIPIKEQSLQKAQSLVDDCNKTVETFQGFSTSKGGKIPIKEHSLQKAQSLVDDCNKTVETFQGFSTAKGGKIPIKEQSLQKAQSLVDDCNKTVEKFQGFSTSNGGKIPIKKQSLQKAQSLVDDCNKTVEKFQGFSTSNGGKIPIKEQSLQKAQSLLNDINETVPDFQGFSTAKGGKIPIKEQSLKKAQSLVDDFNETVPDFQGFSTAKGGKIPIKEQSLLKAQSLVDDCDKIVPDFQGFSTTKGGKIPIKEQSLQKAQTLVDDFNETVPDFQGFSSAKGGKIPIKEQSLQKAKQFMTGNEQYLEAILFPKTINSTKTSDKESLELVCNMQNIKERKLEESRSLKRKLTFNSISEKQLPKRFCPFKSPRIINKSALLHNKFSLNSINDNECNNIFCEEQMANTISPVEKQISCLENTDRDIAGAKYESKSTFPIINLMEKHIINEAEEQNVKEYVTESRDLGGSKIDSTNHLRVSSTTNEYLQEKIQHFPSDDFKCIVDENGETLSKTPKLLEIESKIVRPSITNLQTHEISSSCIRVSSNIASDNNHCNNVCATNNDSQQLHLEPHTNLKVENILNLDSVKEMNQSLEKNVVSDLLLTDLNSSETEIATMAPANNTSGLVEEKSIISPNEDISEQCYQLLDEFQKSFSEGNDSDPIETSESKKRNLSEESDININSVCKRSRCTSDNPQSTSVYSGKEEDYESIISKNSDISDDILAESMEIYENQPFRPDDNKPSLIPLQMCIKPNIHNASKEIKAFNDIPVDNQMNDDISEEQAMTSAVEKMEKEFYFIKSNTVQVTSGKDHVSKQNESEKSTSAYSSNTAGHFVAFQTALGKNVTVSEESVKCAKEILSKNNNEENSINQVSKQEISHKNIISGKSNESEIKGDLADNGKNNQLDSNPHILAFQTALGKNVTVSKKSVKCARQILSENSGEENLINPEISHSNILSEKSNQIGNLAEKNEIDPYPSIFENLQQEDNKLLQLNSKRSSPIWTPSTSHETEDRQRIHPLVTDPIYLHDFSSNKKDCSFQSLLSPSIYQTALSNFKKCTANPSLNTKVSDFKTPYRKIGISLPDSKRTINERAVLENKDIESINKPIFKGCQPSAHTSYSKGNNFKSTLSSDKNSVSDIEYAVVSGDKTVEKVVQKCIKPSKPFSCQTIEKNHENEIQSDVTVAEYKSHLSSKGTSRKYLASKKVQETNIRNTIPDSTKQPDCITPTVYHKKKNINYLETCPEYSERGISASCLQRNKNEEFPIKDHKIHWNINSNNINPEKNVSSLLSSGVSANHENSDSEFSKSANVICFQKARFEQDDIIMKKKKKTVQPNIGLLMSQKQSEKQHRIVEFLKDIPFTQYSHQQLFAFGVRQSALKINSTNAENYHFQLADFYNISYFDKFVIGDGALLVPNDSGSAGKEEFYRSFLTIESVDPNLISQNWFFNHYRWIIWKLASYEVTLPMLFGGRCLSPEMVAHQLKYRYDLEIDNCKRSALRKITERDDTPAKRIVLCISNINKDILKSNICSVIQNNEQCIEVTDGWYSLKMILDNQMMSLVVNKKVRVGQKLCICKAELIGNEEAFNPLEAFSQVQLKVSGNCCRPAKWNSRLGYQCDPRPFAIPLSHINQNGGLVGSVDVVIARIYPIMYMEKISGSRAIFRSSHNEHKVEEQFKRIQQETLERVYSKVQQSYTEIGSRGCDIRPKAFTHKDIAILDNGKDIYDAVVSSLHPESIHEYLTEDQRSLLTEYKQTVQNLRNQKIEEELQKALSDENEKNPKRNVVAVLKVRLVGCSEQDQHHLANTILTIWKPTEDLINMLAEGSRYRIYNIIPSQARFQFLNATTVHLSVTRSTHFECLKIDEKILSKIYSARKVHTSTNIINGPPLQNYLEVDMAGIVLNITKSLTVNQHKLEKLHAVDIKGNIFTICFWGYMQVFSLDGILQEGVVFAAMNLLKCKHDGPHSVTVDASTEISDFTLNPQSNHMKECISQLKDLKVKEGFLSAAYKKFELENLSLDLQGIEQKYQVKENVFQSSEDSVKAQKVSQHLKISKLLAYGTASSLSPLACHSSPSVHKAFKAPSLTKAKK